MIFSAHSGRKCSSPSFPESGRLNGGFVESLFAGAVRYRAGSFQFNFTGASWSVVLTFAEQSVDLETRGHQNLLQAKPLIEHS